MAGDEDFVPLAPVAGGPPAVRFLDALRAVAGEGLVATAAEAAVAALIAALQERQVSEVVAWSHPLLQTLGLADACRAAGIAWLAVETDTDPATVRAAAARAGAGITGADFAVAETGTLVLFSGPGRPRIVSLLPPLHVAVLTADQVLPTIADLTAALARLARAGGLPAAVNLVTGPSRTADIEHVSVRCVHGPGAVLAIVLPCAS